MNEIYEAINGSNTILLLSHENPDGDAIGSLMAFYHMLKEKKKKVDDGVDYLINKVQGEIEQNNKHEMENYAPNNNQNINSKTLKTKKS